MATHGYKWKVLEGVVPNCGIYPMREASFQSSGPKLFNALPRYLRNMKRVPEIEFKEKLDQYLRDIPDEPKVPGSIPSCLTPMEARPTN